MSLRFASILAAVFVVASTGHAQDRPLVEAVAVEPAAEPCLEPAAVAAGVARFLGRDSLDASLGVRLLVAERRFVLERAGIQVAERRFELWPERCDARREAVVLAIGLALEHTLAVEGEAAEAAEPPAVVEPEDPLPEVVAPAVEPPGEDPPAPAPTPAPPPAVEGGTPFTFGLGALVQASALPGVGGGLLAEGGVAWGSLRVGAVAHLLPRAETSLGNGRVRMRGGTGGVELCLLRPLGRLAVGGCAALVAGAVVGVGLGFADDGRGRQAWVAAPVRAVLDLGRRPGVRLSLGLWPSLLRPRFHVAAEDGAILDRAAVPAVGGFAALTLFFAGGEGSSEAAP